jgi:polyisoprenoid-binding protein YceI
MKMNYLPASLLALCLIFVPPAWSDNFVIDKKGQHASITFRIMHLGYSWLTGRFNNFDGEFSYDQNNPEATTITVNIDPASVDTNHAERDKHLRSDDFLDVEKFKTATFVSTSVKQTGPGKAILTGDLTLRGITKTIDIEVTSVGGGKDPWGGYRQGFQGTTQLILKDFNIKKDLGPSSQVVELTLDIEGVRK